MSDVSPGRPEPEPTPDQGAPADSSGNSQGTVQDLYPWRFRPGQSGNPAGRPKGTRAEFRGVARQMSPMVLAKLFQTALLGGQPANVRAGELILAYAWGKPRTELEIRNPKGKPFEITDPNRPSDEELDRKMQALFDAAAKVAEHGKSPAGEDADDEAEDAAAEGAGAET